MRCQGGTTSEGGEGVAVKPDNTEPEVPIAFASPPPPVEVIENEGQGAPTPPPLSPQPSTNANIDTRAPPSPSIEPAAVDGKMKSRMEAAKARREQKNRAKRQRISNMGSDGQQITSVINDMQRAPEAQKKLKPSVDGEDSSFRVTRKNNNWRRDLVGGDITFMNKDEVRVKGEGRSEYTF